MVALLKVVLWASGMNFYIRHQINTKMAAADTLPSVYLQRWGSQSPVGYSTAELDQILAHLSAASTQSTLGYDDVWFAAASPFLLIVDVRWSVNRRLSELFEIAVDRTKPFNLRFVSDEAILDLADALYACGYTGSRVLNPPQLAGVYMTIYRSQSGTGDYATNVGTGIQLVADGGGDTQAARIRTLRGVGALQANLNANGDAVELSLNTTTSGLLDMATVQSWRYIADALDANQGTSLVVQSGGGAQPGRLLRLRSTGGITLAAGSQYLTIGAPLPPPPYALSSVAEGFSLLSTSSSLVQGYLRGLIATPDIQLNVMLNDKDISIGLAAQLFAVRNIKPPNGVLKTIGVHRVEPETGAARIELASDGQSLWNMSATSASFAISSAQPSSSYLTLLQSSATLNGLVITSNAELKWTTPAPLRLQSPSGATALTVNQGGTCDICLNSLITTNGTEVLRIAGTANTVVIQSLAPLSAPSILTPTLQLQGATSSLVLQTGGVPAWTIETLSGGGLQISKANAGGGWVPIVTINPAGRLTAQSLTVTDTAIVTTLSVTGAATVAGQVAAGSFRLASESSPMPSRADYDALLARVAALESRPTGGGSNAALPLYTNDTAAKAGGIPQYGLYRFGKGTNEFRMRTSSDVQQFYYDFGGSGALSMFNSSPPYNVKMTFPFTLEFWAYTNRLYGCSFVHVQNTVPLYSFYVGLNGGGRLEVATDTPFTSYGEGSWAPNTDSWFYVACVVTEAQVRMYAWQDNRVWSGVFTQAISSRFILPLPESYGSITLGRRAGGDYQFQGRISNVRWTNREVDMVNGINTFPLENNAFAETTFCLQGNPATDIVNNRVLGLRGNGTVTYGLMPSLRDYIV